MPVCHLCKNIVDKLSDSHLIPKAAYKHVRARTPGVNSSPIRIDHEKMSHHQTDMQITANFLCETCEQLFSKNGEQIMGTLWATYKGFPLLEKLNEQSRIIEIDGLWTHNDSFLSDKERDGIIYFCISILWRANCWPEKAGGYQHMLGKKYEAMFRDYLLNRTQLKNTYFFVFLNIDQVNSGLFSIPRRYTNDGVSMHSFKMLGIRFEVIVGSKRNEISEPFKITKTARNMLFRTEHFGNAPWFHNLAIQTQAIKSKKI